MEASPRTTVLGGRYRLDGLIGEGGMGAIHRATDLTLERQVAVKVVRPQANSPEARERFLREARSTAQIRHPNIVEVFDFGQTESGDLFFVMELLRGESLAVRLQREGRIPLEEFVTLAGELCDGFGAAHAAGLIHRDIKPANVMLVRHGNRHDLVKILDFGIAKSENATTHLTEAGMFLGTLEYIAPEQILGSAPLDARADVYALGSLFYRMLCGSSLFPKAARSGLIHHHLEVAPERPSVRVPEAGIPRALEDLVLRCLSKSPEERPQNANELRAALDEAVGAPAQARPRPTAPERLPAKPTEGAAEPLIEVEISAAFERTVPTPRAGEPVFAPAPVADLQLDLSTRRHPSPSAPDRTEVMARPAGPTCGACGVAVPPGTRTCAACSAPQAPPRAPRDSAPRESALGGVAPGDVRAGVRLAEPWSGDVALARVKRAPGTLLERDGPPVWLVPLAVLPIWLAIVVILLCGASAAGLWAFQVDAKIAYWGLAVVSTLAGIGIYVRRRIEAAE
ncbi:MAG TPA: protein kinase [Polyangiaceae bacterium]|nr:protein kinase [Polyangiaceae bacterium]